MIFSFNWFWKKIIIFLIVYSLLFFKDDKIILEKYSPQYNYLNDYQQKCKDHADNIEKLLGLAKIDIKNNEILSTFFSLNIFENLEISQVLGCGTYGIVIQVKQKNQQQNEYALKVSIYFKKEELENINNILKEVDLIQEGKNYFQQTIDKINPIIIQNDTNKYYIYCYYIDIGYPLYQKIIFSDKQTSQEEKLKVIVQIILQIVDAFKLLNKQGYNHGDVKPQNLLIINKNNQNQLKVIDFDFLLNLKNRQYKVPFPIYTVDYRPLELMIYFDKEKKDELTEYGDILFNQHKFSQLFLEEAYAVGKTIQEIYEINFDIFNFKDQKSININNLLQELIKNLTSITQRITLNQAQKILENYQQILIDPNSIQPMIKTSNFIQAQNLPLLQTKDKQDQQLYYLYLVAQEKHKKIWEQLKLQIENNNEFEGDFETKLRKICDSESELKFIDKQFRLQIIQNMEYEYQQLEQLEYVYQQNKYNYDKELSEQAKPQDQKKTIKIYLV